MPEKRPTTCQVCGYRWKTRAKDPLKIVCPKCHPKKNGMDGKRQRVTCACGFSWTSRRPPVTAICPQCQGRDIVLYIREWATKVEDIPGSVAPAPPFEKNRATLYGKTAIEQFIRGLGCWSADNFGRCMANRTNQEYKRDLENLIELNKTRHDAVGKMETEAAYRVLRRLGQ